MQNYDVYLDIAWYSIRFYYIKIHRSTPMNDSSSPTKDFAANFTSDEHRDDGQQWLEKIANDPNRHHKVLDRYQKLIKLLLKPNGDESTNNEENVVQSNSKIVITHKAHAVDKSSASHYAHTKQKLVAQLPLNNIATQTMKVVNSISTQTDPTVEVTADDVDALKTCRLVIKRSLLKSSNALERKETIKDILLTMHSGIQDALHAVNENIHDLEMDLDTNHT